MEKDHFKDRTIETTLVNEIKEGEYVYICLKAMQSSASSIEDLSFGKVTKVLTKHNHDRGIKVMIDSYINPNELNTLDKMVAITEEHHIGFTQVGRVVYTTTNGVIHRKK